MKIRFAQEADVAAIVALGRDMVAESRFNCYEYEPEKTSRAVAAMVGSPANACVLLAERADGQLAGMLSGYATEYFFCNAVVVQDRWFYVKPEHRGSSAAVKLLMAFRKWGEQRKADELCINMSVGIDMARFNKLMTHLGFQCCGSNFSLALKG